MYSIGPINLSIERMEWWLLVRWDDDDVKSSHSQRVTGINLSHDKDQQKKEWNEGERVSLNTRVLFLHLVKFPFWSRSAVHFPLEMQNDLMLSMLILSSNENTQTTIFRYDWNSQSVSIESKRNGGQKVSIQLIRTTLLHKHFLNPLFKMELSTLHLIWLDFLSFCCAAKCRFCSVATCSRINLAHAMWFESKCNHRVMSQERLSISLHSISLGFFSGRCIFISRWKLLRASLVPHVCRNVAGKQVKSCNINIETTAFSCI